MKRLPILAIALLTSQLTIAQCIGDCQNDFGIMKKSDSEFYKGFFKNGTKDGLGYEGSGPYYYYGQFKNGKRDGMGVYKDEKGMGYGNWKNGQKSGWHSQLDDSNGNFNVANYQSGEPTKAQVVKGVWEQLPAEDKCLFGDCQDGFGCYFYRKYGAIAEGFWMQGKIMPFSVYNNFNMAKNSTHYKDLNTKLDGRTLMVEEFPDNGYTMISEVVASTGTPKGKVLIFYNDGYSKIVEVDGDKLIRAVFEGTTENLVKN